VGSHVVGRSRAPAEELGCEGGQGRAQAVELGRMAEQAGRARAMDEVVLRARTRRWGGGARGLGRRWRKPGWSRVEGRRCTEAIGARRGGAVLRRPVHGGGAAGRRLARGWDASEQRRPARGGEASC